MDDKLAIHRDARKREDDGVFYSWLNANCINAKPICEVRKLLSGVKRPIREELKDDDC